MLSPAMLIAPIHNFFNRAELDHLKLPKSLPSSNAEIGDRRSSTSSAGPRFNP